MTQLVSTTMDNIQIFELILKDYRQYQGENKISLETTSDQNINIIEGQNGAGKSNILNAITLCFYGEETHTDSQGGSELETDPYITKKVLDSLNPGESAEGYIEIKLGKKEPKFNWGIDIATTVWGKRLGAYAKARECAS